MSFANLYKPYIAEETSCSKPLIEPRNIYKISSYVYADGEQKTLSGNESAYIFVLGISPDKVISCIKLSEVKPDRFFKWMKPLFKKGITEKIWQEAKSLDDVLIKTDRTGSKLFNSFVKSSTIYNQNPTPYRTYTLKGIRQVKEVKFKQDFLKTLV